MMMMQNPPQPLPTETPVKIKGIIHYIPKIFYEGFNDARIRRLDSTIKPNEKIYYKLPDHPAHDTDWKELKPGEILQLFPGMIIESME